MWLIICLFYLFFIRFVRPTKMSEQAINKYIKGKYGELGVDRYAASFLLLSVIKNILLPEDTPPNVLSGF